MNEMKALIIEDEVNARNSLKAMLDCYCPQVNLLGEAATVNEARLLLDRFQPDLIFLDVEMPGQPGYELLEHLEADVQVIFTTAHAQYAVKAFELSALDYLLKPIDPERLCGVIIKAMSQQKQQQNVKRYQALLAAGSTGTNGAIAIPYKGDYDIVDLEQIVSIEADRMYSHLTLSSPKPNRPNRYLCSKKLSHFEFLLEDYPQFQRVHRSWMINRQHILSYSKKDHTIQLRDQQVIPVSKGYRQEFEVQLGL